MPGLARCFQARIGLIQQRGESSGTRANAFSRRACRSCAARRRAGSRAHSAFRRATSARAASGWPSSFSLRRNDPAAALARTRMPSCATCLSLTTPPPSDWRYSRSTVRPALRRDPCERQTGCDHSPAPHRTTSGRRRGLRSAGQSPARCHPVQGGIQPQSKKYFRRNRRTSHAAFHRPIIFVETLQVLPLDIGPHQSHPVPFRQQ